jgi:hypothetical protein
VPVSYSYAINTVRVVTQGDLVDVVKEIDVNVWGVDGELQFHLPVTVRLSDADPQTFTSFAFLTLEQATAWIDADAGAEHAKSHIAAVLVRMAEEASMQAKPIPWAQ